MLSDVHNIRLVYSRSVKFPTFRVNIEMLHGFVSRLLLSIFCFQCFSRFLPSPISHLPTSFISDTYMVPLRRAYPLLLDHVVQNLASGTTSAIRSPLRKSGPLPHLFPVTGESTANATYTGSSLETFQRGSHL